MYKKPELVVGKINDKGAQVTLLNTRLTFVYLDKPQKGLNPGKHDYKVTCLIPEADFKRTIRNDFDRVIQKMLGVSSKMPGAKERKEAYTQTMNDGAKKSLFKIGNKPGS